MNIHDHEPGCQRIGCQRGSNWVCHRDPISGLLGDLALGQRGLKVFHTGVGHQCEREHQEFQTRQPLEMHQPGVGNLGLIENLLFRLILAFRQYP